MDNMDIKTQPPAGEHEINTPPQRKGGVMNKLYPPGPQPGAKGRVKNHCRKFWWCDCLVLVILVLVIVLPLIFVGLPKKAQHEINGSTLEVTRQEVTNPTPEGVQLQIDTVIKSGSSYHPTIDAFNAALSLGGEEPFLHIDIPEAKSEGETFITVDQAVKFASTDAFTGYAKKVISSDEFDIYLDGKTTVHIKGLPAMDVDYNKVVKMKGLNHLKGLNITDLEILSGDEVLADGSNMVGNVFIPNPSVMTLDLGNVTMNLAIDGKPVGTALLPDLVLRPGDNNIHMQAYAEKLVVIGLVTSKYTNGVVPLDISGNSSVHSGQHLTYYEAAIQANTIRVDLNLAPALATLGLNVTSSE